MISIKEKADKAWVTFTLPVHDEVNEVLLCGSFNEWEPIAMKRKKNGEYYTTKVMALNQTYEFGYKIDGAWHIDEACDTTPSPFMSENSLLKL